MRQASTAPRGANSGPRAPLGVMAPPNPVRAQDREQVDRVLRTFVGAGWRGGALRARLAERYPDRPPEEIEDAVQEACAAFLAEGEGVTEERAVFAWIRTAANHALVHELRRHGRVIPFDPGGEGPLAAARTDGPGPAEELIALEDDVDLEVLVREVASSLSGTRREVLALWARGRRRTEIAAELGVGERVVKRSLEEIMGEARSALARHAGGGCEEGEGQVLRLLCGLVSSAEAAEARAHLHRCGRCSAFAGSLEAWKEKAGAILPLPALEAADPGLLARSAGRVGHALDSVRRHLLGGAHHAGGRTLAGVGPAAPDPTPLAGFRPGAVAAVLAGCLAVGGGATYCARQGVDPLAAAGGLIGATQEPTQEEAPKPAPETQEPAEAPVYQPPAEEAPTYQPAEEAPATTQPSSSSESSASHESKAQAEPEPVVEEVTPPAEQAFGPASPDYPATEATTTTSSSSESSSSASGSSEAKAVPANEAPQFGGP